MSSPFTASIAAGASHRILFLPEKPKYDSSGASRKSVFMIKGINVNYSSFSLELRVCDRRQSSCLATMKGTKATRDAPNPHVDIEQDLPLGFCEVKVKLLVQL